MRIFEKIVNFIFAEDSTATVAENKILPMDIYIQYQLAAQKFTYADKYHVEAAIYDLCRIESQISSMRGTY